MTPVPPDPALNRKALYSIGYAIVAFGTALFIPFVGVLLAVPALTCGVHGRREITASQGEQRGAELALYGIGIGIAAMLVGILGFVLVEFRP